LIYTASVLMTVWGVAHLLATRGVVAGFGALSEDNRRIITMEWIVEGVALIATGAFVSAAALVDPASGVAFAVYAVAIATLIVLAFVSIFTGFRIAFLPFRLCPIIFGICAALIAWGAWG
jgi:predicted RND superfamily exporter protein